MIGVSPSQTHRFAAGLIEDKSGDTPRSHFSSVRSHVTGTQRCSDQRSQDPPGLYVIEKQDYTPSQPQGMQLEKGQGVNKMIGKQYFS